MVGRRILGLWATVVAGSDFAAKSTRKVKMGKRIQRLRPSSDCDCARSKPFLYDVYVDTYIPSIIPYILAYIIFRKKS